MSHIEARPPRDGEPTLEERIEDAWGEGGPDRAVLEPGQLQKRIQIQRLAFGISWILMLPFFVWLMWPWIDDAISSGNLIRDVEVEGAGRRVGRVAARLRDLNGVEGGEADAERRELREELDELRSRIARASDRREDVETRVAIGASGLLIWVIIMAVVIRNRGLGSP